MISVSGVVAGVDWLEVDGALPGKRDNALNTDGTSALCDTHFEESHYY